MDNTSFLPDDYLAQKAERRTNVISLTLFGVVMIAVIGAFFVTNRQASQLKDQQEAINDQYQQAGVQIQELTELEKQREEMLNKAELAAALVERVPRSILMAELINRMPERLALLEFELKSEKVKAAPQQPQQQKDASGRLVANAKPEKAKTVQEMGAEAKKVDPPKHDVNITMVGVAPTDLELSKFMNSLNNYPLLRGVSLEYSEQKEIQGRMMRQFKIAMTLNQTADVRRIDPLIVPRIKNPMTDEVQLNAPVATHDMSDPGDASASATKSQGD
jgi:hypothetical protein